jgi:hypothetical protein
MALQLLCGTRRIFSLGIRFVLSGNFGLLWKSYLLNHFFRDIIPKKGVSEFWTNLLILTIKSNSYLFHNLCHEFWILFSKPWDLDSRLGGWRTRVIDGLFFEFLEDKERRFKTNLTLSLILRFNLRLGGYSMWSASLTALHIKEDLKTTRSLSTSQPRYNQRST